MRSPSAAASSWQHPVWSAKKAYPKPGTASAAVVSRNASRNARFPSPVRMCAKTTWSAA